MDYLAQVATSAPSDERHTPRISDRCPGRSNTETFAVDEEEEEEEEEG